MKPSTLRKYHSADGVPPLPRRAREKVYEGKRTDTGVVVTVDGVMLRERQDLRNHSPTGFEWGYGGSGPAQLALAILADHLGDDHAALALYQDFKFNVVAALPGSWWKLTSEDLNRCLRRIQSKPSKPQQEEMPWA